MRGIVALCLSFAAFILECIIFFQTLNVRAGFVYEALRGVAITFFSSASRFECVFRKSVDVEK